MGKMGIESVEKKFDYRVIEITRTGTYKAVADIAVPDNKLILVALDNSDPAQIQIKEYDGTSNSIIIGVIKESVSAGENAVVIKRGKIDIKSLDTSNISGLDDYEVIELLEHQDLFLVNISERKEF